jgi:chemotaxis family two-component system response regulator Rcp1
MPTRGHAQPVAVLLVEDCPDDAELMVKALRQCALEPLVNVVEDGEEAIDYLRRQGAFCDAVRPDLILLDLHLPRKGGHEVLAEIKADDRLRRIPVIIMTGSEDETDFQTAYELYANCCVSKPSDLDEFALAVKQIERFWLRVASIPRDP